MESRRAKMKTLPEGSKCRNGYRFWSSPNNLWVSCKKGSGTLPPARPGTNSYENSICPPTTRMEPSGNTWLLAYHRRACNSTVASSAQSQVPPARPSCTSLIIHLHKFHVGGFLSRSFCCWLRQALHIPGAQGLKYRILLAPSKSPPVCTRVPSAIKAPELHQVSVIMVKGRTVFGPGVNSAEWA